MNKYRITGGSVFQADGSFTRRDLYVCGERLVSPAVWEADSGKEQLLDAAGCYVTPGLTDVHFHGCVGVDCCDGSEVSFEEIARFELSKGVTSITPATMTMPEDTLARIAAAVKAVRDRQAEGAGGAEILGLYMEGPFISLEKKGAQNASYIRPADAAMVAHLQKLSGDAFRTVVVAPETQGALDFIEEVSPQVRISLAHTTADYDTAREAFRRGARQLTHLYNAMPGISHRAPGPILAAAEREDVMVELICDGIHIHPAVVRMTFRLFGDDRIIFISDTMRACGLENGTYDLGGQDVHVDGNRATLADGTIAGSVTCLTDCLRRAVREMGIPLGSAVKCAAVNPIRALGLLSDYGTLEEGKFANLLLLDQETLELKRVFLKGRPQD